VAFSDYLQKVLEGGLPAIVDGGNATAQGDTRPEQTPPTGTQRDRESFAATAGAALGQYGPYIALGVVVLLGVVFIVAARGK
jgi:hypothetical protein